MVDNESTRVRTARAFLKAYSLLSPEALLNFLDDNFKHTVLPSSLDLPSRDKKSFEIHAGRVTSIFSSFAMIPQSLFEDPVENTVIAHAKMVGDLIGLGSWENEGIMIMRMAEGSSKIVEIEEFVDSARARLLQEKLASRGKEQVFKE